MNPQVHLTAEGILLAVIFASAMGGLLLWMFRLPMYVTAPAAKARRAVDAVKCIIVPTVGQPYSERGVELACRLGRDQKAEIVLTYVLEVPRTLPLNAPLPESTQKAEEALERGSQIVKIRGLLPVTHIERAREASEGIIRAARDRQADLIVLGIRPNVGARDTVFGRTTDALLSRAPCEVIVDKMPGE